MSQALSWGSVDFDLIRVGDKIMVVSYHSTAQSIAEVSIEIDGISVSSCLGWF